MGICCGLLTFQIKYIDTFIKLDAVKLEFKNHRILELLSMLWINSNEKFSGFCGYYYTNNCIQTYLSFELVWNIFLYQYTISIKAMIYKYGKAIYFTNISNYMNWTCNNISEINVKFFSVPPSDSVRQQNLLRAKRMDT